MSLKVLEHLTPGASVVLEDVFIEIARAGSIHPPLRGTHEAYAVLLEEVDEFWDEVRKRNPDKTQMRLELIQIAAMACRTILDLKL